MNTNEIPLAGRSLFFNTFRTRDDVVPINQPETVKKSGMWNSTVVKMASLYAVTRTFVHEHVVHAENMLTRNITLPVWKMGAIVAGSCLGAALVIKLYDHFFVVKRLKKELDKRIEADKIDSITKEAINDALLSELNQVPQSVATPDQASQPPEEVLDETQASTGMPDDAGHELSSETTRDEPKSVPAVANTIEVEKRDGLDSSVSQPSPIAAI